MKKRLIVFTVIGILALSIIASGYSESLLQAVKTLPMGTTITEARKTFEDFKLKEVRELPFSQKTFFTYEEEGEEVELVFQNKFLSGFNYQNKKIEEASPARKTEEALAKGSDKMIQFADDDDSKITAEVKNCLAMILGNAELLLRQEKNITPEGREKLEEIKSQVWRIDSIMDKLE